MLRPDLASASLEDRLREAQRLASLGALAGALAHDFNNLIATILANTDLVRRHLDEDADDDRRRLDDVVSAAHGAADLARQMLACAGPDAGPGPHARLDLQQLVAEMRPLLDAVLAEGARLELSLGAVPPVRADANQLRQVVLNLITNASDALDERPGTVRLALGADPGGLVALAVIDDGRGLDEATRGRLFDPSFTTKDPVGHGLGLPVVLGIVRTHGGEVTVDSAPGRGTTVTVTLPAAG